MAFAASLRGDRAAQERTIEEGVPFFVPQLSKVKTTVMCQTTNPHLLFCFEKPGGSGSGSGSGTASGAASDGSGSSYRKQGNQDLYSEENLRKRQRLLEDKQVLAAIARFWETFPHIRQGHTTLERRDYVDVFIKFFKALVAPSEFSMAEAKKIVERDWERDVGDADIMTRPLFNRALFEVADIWTVGIGPDIYTSFLKKLFDRVTMTVFDQDKSMWLTVFADLDKIRPFAEPKTDREPQSVAASAAAGAMASTVSATTNQDVDTVSATGSGGSGAVASGGANGSVTKSKPPLLKKKMLSLPSGLGSPTKSNPLSMLPAAEAMGGSMRRLPDLQTSAAASPPQSHQGIVGRGPRSPRAAVATEPSVSSRSEGSAISYAVETPEVVPLTRKAPASATTGVSAAVASTSAVVKSASPARAAQKSSTVRKETNGGVVTSTKRREDNTEENPGPHASPSSQEVPPQQVRFTMPSIYLSPEITPSNGAEVAARRRIRESMKLAQRLRRITF